MDTVVLSRCDNGYRVRSDGFGGKDYNAASFGEAVERMAIMLNEAFEIAERDPTPTTDRCDDGAVLNPQQHLRTR